MKIVKVCLDTTNGPGQIVMTSKIYDIEEEREKAYKLSGIISPYKNVEQTLAYEAVFAWVKKSLISTVVEYSSGLWQHIEYRIYETCADNDVDKTILKCSKRLKIAARNEIKERKNKLNSMLREIELAGETIEKAREK